MALEKKCMLMPRWLSYVIRDKEGFWGREKLGLTEDAPEWAKEEYEKWWQEELLRREQLIKL
ncbi:Uncharacterised protein [Eubacterium limosum]|uniref:Uncharacterized protein n=1 Tax=Eubacterium limosum TaxID=1736 RepID=A0A6N3FQ38_EUBLI|nr:hypothetical protein [Eubacterium limosum]